MSLFDELRKQIQAAIDEAQGRQPAAPSPRAPARPAPRRQPAQAQQRRTADDEAAARTATEAQQAAAQAVARRSAAPPPVINAAAHTNDESASIAEVRALLSDRHGLRSAVILNEVLGPPLAMRPRGLRR